MTAKFTTVLKFDLKKTNDKNHSRMFNLQAHAAGDFFCEKNLDRGGGWPYFDPLTLRRACKGKRNL